MSELNIPWPPIGQKLYPSKGTIHFRVVKPKFAAGENKAPEEWAGPARCRALGSSSCAIPPHQYTIPPSSAAAETPCVTSRRSTISRGLRPVTPSSPCVANSSATPSRRSARSAKGRKAIERSFLKAWSAASGTAGTASSAAPHSSALRSTTAVSSSTLLLLLYLRLLCLKS